MTKSKTVATKKPRPAKKASPDTAVMRIAALEQRLTLLEQHFAALKEQVAPNTPLINTPAEG